jgi:hypothetical protein
MIGMVADMRAFFGEHGDTVAKIDANQAEKCPGCSGQTEYFDAGIRRCVTCDGLVGRTSMERAERYVTLDAMQANAPVERMRYFDFTFDNKNRVHGWYDRETKKVVQYG